MVLVAALTIVILRSGGGSVELLGVRLAATNAVRAAGALVLLLVVFLRLTRQRPAAAVDTWAAAIRPDWLAAVLAVHVLLVGTTWGSKTGGGSDSYGYISQADLILRGRLSLAPPPLAPVPWPNGLETLTPLGYRSSPDGTAIVPVYPIGLPLMMAAARSLGGHPAIFAIVPLAGALAIVSVYLLGIRLGSPWIGLGAAWLLAANPVLLYMLMNPMSDVPVTALWLAAAVACASPRPGAALLGGLLTGLAVLVRPNLAPLAGVLALFKLAAIWWRTPRALLSVGLYALGPLAAAITLATINTRLYGSALNSGYGRASDLFAAGNVATNLRHWGAWLAETRSVFLIAGLPLLLFPLRSIYPAVEPRRVAALLGFAALVILGSYVAYMPFESLWFLRFLLPAWPLLMLGVAALATALGRQAGLAGRVAVGAAVVWLGAETAAMATARDVFSLGDSESRYSRVARAIHDVTDPRSVIISGMHSGSLRYYGGRMTLRYDQMPPEWMDRAVEWLRGHGWHPYFALDEGELDVVRKIVGGQSQIGRLSFNPVVVLDHQIRVSLFDPLADPQVATRVLPLPPVTPLGDRPAPME